MSVDMDIHGYPWLWISMDIHRKSVDMDMDMDVKFHIHGNPGVFSPQIQLGVLRSAMSSQRVWTTSARQTDSGASELKFTSS